MDQGVAVPPDPPPPRPPPPPPPLSPGPPPFPPGERGEGTVVMKAADGFEDGFDLGLDLVVGEAKDAVAEGVEIGVPVLVMRDLRVFFVDGAVQLQDEPQLVAEEVRDIG